MEMESIILEKQTIQRVLSGEVSFFSQIIDRHHKKISAYLSKRCSNLADVEDLTQETFIAAYHNLSQYDSAKPFSAWLFGIARNKSNEHFRKAARIPTPADLSSIQEVAHADSPDTVASHTERAHQFWQHAKALLTETQYSAIWLKYQSELSVAEISEALGLTESNAKVQLFRARKKLADSSLINHLAS